MTPEINFFKKYESWIRSGILLLSILALHYFDDRYVSRVTYSEDQKSLYTSIGVIRDSLGSLHDSVNLFDQNRHQLEDHEARIRHLEHRP